MPRSYIAEMDSVELPPLRLPILQRVLATGGIVGPIVFVAGWSLLGTAVDGYSHIDDPISELARDGRSTQAIMTVVFVVFGLALIGYSVALRRWLAGRSWMPALANGTATIGVAASPLGSPVSNELHGVFAICAYLTLVGLPMMAAGELTGRHRRRSRWLGAAVFSMLMLSVFGPGSTDGLFQRAGLTIGDVWIVLTAIQMARARHPSVLAATMGDDKG